MNKKKIFIPLVLVLIALVIWLAAGKTGGGDKNAGEIKNSAEVKTAVKTAAATAGTIKPSLTVSGSVAGNREVVLTAKTQGVITSLRGRAGDRVEAGQTVVALESNNQRLAVEKSLEQINAAKLVLDKAETDFGRIEELYKQGAVSKSEYDNAEYALNVARVAYNVAVSDNRLASKSMSDTSVTAPFSGSVVECLVEQGEMVFPGSKLMTVVEDTSLIIKAGLTPEQQKLVRAGQEGIFTTTIYAGKEFPCQVKSISSKADPASRNFAVEFSLAPAAAKNLKPGMFGHVKLVTEGISGILIPREAIITRDEAGRAEVYVIAGGKALKKKINTGDSDDVNIIVFEGLKAGDKVVTFGQSRLKDGISVTEGE